MMIAIRPYTTVALIRLQEQLQYRLNALAGASIGVFWGGIMVMMLAAFYESGAVGQGSMILPHVITFVWLSRVAAHMFPHGDPEIITKMRDGDVAHDRLRPLDHYWFWAAKGLGYQMPRVLLQGTTIFAVTVVILPLVGLGDWALQPPADIWAGSLFIMSLGLQIAMGVAVLMIMNAFTVMHIAGYGIIAMVRGVVHIGAGATIPLPLYPDWMQGFLLLQPFATMGDISSRIYTGLVAGEEALQLIGLQIFWLIIFVWIGRVMMARVMRAIEVQGG